jgi:hypothetical protein
MALQGRSASESGSNSGPSWPSELVRLDDLIHDALAPIRTDVEHRAVEAIVAAALAFAAEYPDAPRAVREADAA